MARLVVKLRDGTVKEQELRAVTSIGRQSANEVQLSEELASRQHARIIPSGRSFVIEDLQSANGTFVNGQRIQRRVLADGDLIRIGGCELVFRDDAAKDLVGELISDRYRVLGKLGSGGMGTVYKALQISMDRQVALKVLNPELTRDREFVMGFLNEARTAGQLNHPNIIQVHDFGEHQGLYYFSMELVEGENVLAVLNREGKILPARALGIIAQLCDALAHAHAHNIVHQDIKPQNLILDRRIKDQVKLADLGLAKVIGQERGQRRGLLMGTPHYMAPEQARSQPVDGRTDIYAAGASLFHMLTGRVPYDGKNSIEILTKHVKSEVPDLRQYDVSIPEPVARLVARMMAKDPAARPASARELAESIRGILEQERAALERAPIKRPPAPAMATTRTAPRRVALRRRTSPSVLPWMLAGLMLVVLVVVALYVHGLTPGEGPPVKPGAAEVQLAAMLKAAQADLQQGRLDSAEATYRQVAARAAEGSAAQILARSRLDEITRLRVDAAARSELNQILTFIRRNPADLEEAQRRLEGFLAKYGASHSAGEARRELERVKKALADRLRPAADREQQAQEALGPCLAQARELEKQGAFRAAERALLDFAAMHSDTKASEKAKQAAADLHALAENFLGDLWNSAQKAGKAKKYRQAADLYSQLISRDADGEWGRKAREALAEQDTATEAACQEALKTATEQFNAFDFAKSARTAERAAAELLGTRWQAGLERLSFEATACGRLHAAMVNKIANYAQPLPAGFKIKGPEGWEYDGQIVGASLDGVNVKGGPAILTRPWKDLTPQDLARIYLVYVVPDEHHLAASYLFLRRGLKEEARAELRRALAVAATAEAAGARLAELEGRANLLTYDFSSGLQVSDWAVTSGVWGIAEGELVGGGPGESAIELRKARYQARGLRLSFEFTIKSQSGILTAEVGDSERDYVGVSIDPKQGTALTSAVNGAPTTSTENLKLAPGKRHLVKLAVTNGQLEVTVDDAKPLTLKAPQIETLTGTLRFKLIDGQVALDNVQIRNDAVK